MTEVIKLNQEWLIGKQLRLGGFGCVHLAQSTHGELVVIKLIPKAPGAEREVLFEDLVGIPNVVPILDRGEWKDYWVIVMPKANKSLRDYLGEKIATPPIGETVQVLSHVAEALAGIAERVVHRDIKPDNILLLEGQWCLADFGISRYAEAVTASDTRKFAKTAPYAAPEQWRGERATSATDVYAYGVVAYELLAGQVPFMGPDDHDYRRQHLEDTPEPISEVPLNLQSLISECLYKSPESRPRSKNLLVRLNDSIQAASESGNRLQQANFNAVQLQAEVTRKESVARSKVARRNELDKAAHQSLMQISGLLDNQILSNAPACKRTGPFPESYWSLNEAKLSLAQSQMAKQQYDEDFQGSLFEIVAYSSITLNVIPDGHGYEGRSHSLWYCDAQEAGKFRWYETAFMLNPFSSKRDGFSPFKFSPGWDAYNALLPGMDKFQVAWPFIPIDQGDYGEFIERWIGWFADAAQGQLRYPSHMPERNPSGTWRRGE